MYRHLSQLYCATADTSVLASCRRAISVFPHWFALCPITHPGDLPAGAAIEDWLILDAELLRNSPQDWISSTARFPGQIVWLGRDRSDPALPGRRPARIDLDDDNWTDRLIEVLEPLDATERSPGRTSPPRRPVSPPSPAELPPLAAGGAARETSPLRLAAELASLRQDRILDVIIDRLVPALGASRASFYSFDSGRQRLVLSRHSHPGTIDCVVGMAETSRPMVAALAAGYRVRIIDDWECDPLAAAVLRPNARNYRSNHCAIVPISDPADDQALLGVLNLADRSDSPAGFAPDADRLADWAHVIARAWINAREFERALRAAGTDELTGLGNYRQFHSRLAQEAERGKRYGVPLSMIMIDVDNLKQVNDTLGHAGGDILLKTVAHRISEEIRQIDHAARLGGDEFAVILPSTDLAAAKAVADRVLRRVRRRPVRWNGTTIQPAASLGVGQFEPDISLREFIHRVDQSLYAAKTGGRNCVATCETGD
jgi:diguanylate cyclase (GGDEF)-like protein